MKVKARLAKLGICACGYTMLWEDIPLGSLYSVYLDSDITGTVICGKCSKHNKCTFILVDSPNGPGYMPKEIFEITNEEVAAQTIYPPTSRVNTSVN